MTFSLKRKIKLPLLFIYLEKLKAVFKRDVYTPFVAALFTGAKRWQKAKCLSTNKWINKMLYTHIMEYYTALKMKNSLAHATYNMDELGEHYAIQISLLQKTQLFYDSTYV